MKTIQIRTYILLFFLIFLSYERVFSQEQKYDIIIKNDKSTVLGKVLKVTDSQIEIDPKGDIPFLIINRGEVESIEYSDGTLVKFDQSPKTNVFNATKPKMQLSREDGTVVYNDELKTSGGVDVGYIFHNNPIRSFIYVFSEDGIKKDLKIEMSYYWDSHLNGGKLLSKSDLPRVNISNFSITVRLYEDGNLVYTSEQISFPVTTLGFSNVDYSGRNVDNDFFSRRMSVPTITYKGITINSISIFDHNVITSNFRTANYDFNSTLVFKY